MSNDYISLLPFYTSPETLFVSDKIPCHAGRIERKPTKSFLNNIKREKWIEGLYVKKIDVDQIKRYKHPNGHYKNDFDEKIFLEWVKSIEDNTAICELENTKIGKCVFVLPGKTLPKGTFIPSSGIIKLNPTIYEFETKSHCSALQDLESTPKKIYGLIDPEMKGGILDFINHAPNEDEIPNFLFKTSSVKEYVATSNLNSSIKFYNGYAIMGIEVFKDIEGGKYGKQLLWSYARSDEYLTLNNQTLWLFDNRDEHNGEIVDANFYSLKIINIFLDVGEVILREITSLSRWELLEASPKSEFIFSIEDPYSYNQSEIIYSSICYGGACQGK